MLHDRFHDVLAIGAAVGTETPDMNSERPHHLEEAAVGLCLHEAHVGIAVTVLQIGNQPTDGEHARAVAVKAFVGALAVVLLCLQELMVEVHVVPAAFRELPGGQQQLDEQLVQFLRRVEVIDVAGLFRCIRYVLRCQFLYAAPRRQAGGQPPEDRIRATGRLTSKMPYSPGTNLFKTIGRTSIAINPTQGLLSGDFSLSLAPLEHSLHVVLEVLRLRGGRVALDGLTVLRNQELGEDPLDVAVFQFDFVAFL